MHRFYLPPEKCDETLLTLEDAEAHHALHVVRLEKGEEVTVLNGAGQELKCEVVDRKRESVALRVLERKTTPPPQCTVTLLQAVPKAKIIESIIQKATELGAARIVPILSERVVTQLDARDGEAKKAKWQSVAVEAIKQCGSAWLPKVERPITPQEFLARGEKFELPLLGCLEPGSRHPREWFNKFFAQHNRAPRTIVIWVGPEGDFTAAEYEMIKGAGALPITLGPLVLRVETAAIYCLSILNYELQAPR